MPIIRIAGGPPNCPLCGNVMREIIMNKHFFYTCTREMCMVSINKKDPCIQKWGVINSADQAPKCQFCHKPMKVFVRQDKLVIMQCRDKSHAPYQIARGDARALPPI
jgi:hypothetical protein